MKVTILGCGPSVGVPAIGNVWGACDPANPRNRRTRTSILIERPGSRILVDAGPDARAQLLAAGVDHLDAVVITHQHSDHVQGLDELRPFAFLPRKPIPLYASAETLANLTVRFGYLFTGQYYKQPFLVPHEVVFGETIQDLGIEVFEQDHYVCRTLGLRCGFFGYSTDVVRLNEAAFKALEGVDTWVVAALREEKHEAHGTLSDALSWIDRLQPRRAILTHMGSDMDYDALRRRLPANVEPAYDGLVIDLDD